MKNPHGITLPYFFAFAALTAGAQEATSADPAAKITVECRLLETTPAHADEAISSMVRWRANPVVLGRLLLKQLWGDGIKRSLEMETVVLPGMRGKSENRTGPQQRWVPAGQDPQPWQIEIQPGEQFEVDARRVGKGALANTVELEAYFHSQKIAGPLMIQSNCLSHFVCFNGIPVFLGRCDMAGRSRLMVARASWFSPGVEEQRLGGMISPLYLRSQILAVPKGQEAEAARRFAQGAGFASWLKEQCPAPAMLGLSASPKGSHLRVEFAAEDQFLSAPAENGYQRHLHSGYWLLAEAKVTADQKAAEMKVELECRLPAEEAGAQWANVADRDFQLATQPMAVSTRMGEANVIRMSEWLPAGLSHNRAKLVETADVFLVLELFRPGQ